MEELKKLITFLIVFISCIHKITSSSNDALRCNKVFSDNYYLGQVCVLNGKIIDRTTDWNAQGGVSEKNPEQIKTVIFQDSKVIYVPSQLFTKYTSIERIYLNSTEVESIDADSFDRAGNVKEIHLNQNKIQVIKNGVFSKARQCHILDLSQNHIDQLENDAFEGLSAVRKLSLNMNRIVSIAAEVFQPLIQLNYLDLSRNNIETFIDGVFEHNRALQHIDLSYNSIKVLSLNLQNNNLIQTLDVSSNVIEAASIQRRSDATRVLTVYAGNNQWLCDNLNKTIDELAPINIKLTAKLGQQLPRDRSTVNSIDCHDTGFFNFNSDNINWPILGVVVGMAIVFIVGALVLIFCLRRRKRRSWSSKTTTTTKRNTTT